MGNTMDMRSLEHCLGDIMRGVDGNAINANSVAQPDALKGKRIIFDKFNFFLDMWLSFKIEFVMTISLKEPSIF